MRYDRAVYQALFESGMSKREIARHLGVNEASVRRGLKGYKRRPKLLVTVHGELD